MVAKLNKKKGLLSKNKEGKNLAAQIAPLADALTNLHNGSSAAVTPCIQGASNLSSLYAENQKTFNEHGITKEQVESLQFQMAEAVRLQLNHNDVLKNKLNDTSTGNHLAKLAEVEQKVKTDQIQRMPNQSKVMVLGDRSDHILYELVEGKEFSGGMRSENSYPMRVDRKDMTLAREDISEEYARLRGQSYGNTNGFVLVYNANLEGSLDKKLAPLVAEARHHCPDAKITLCGFTYEGEPQISQQQHADFMKAHNITEGYFGEYTPTASANITVQAAAAPAPIYDAQAEKQKAKDMKATLKETKAKGKEVARKMQGTPAIVVYGLGSTNSKCGSLSNGCFNDLCKGQEGVNKMERFPGRGPSEVETIPLGGSDVQLREAQPQKEYARLRTLKYPGSDGIVLIYDACDTGAKDKLEAAIAEINHHAPDTPISLMGFTDSDRPVVLTQKEHDAFVNKHKNIEDSYHGEYSLTALQQHTATIAEVEPPRASQNLGGT